MKCQFWITINLNIKFTLGIWNRYRISTLFIRHSIFVNNQLHPLDNTHKIWTTISNFDRFRALTIVTTTTLETNCSINQLTWCLWVMTIQPSSDAVSARNSFAVIWKFRWTGSLLPAGAINLYHLTPFHEPRFPLPQLPI